MLNTPSVQAGINSLLTKTPPLTTPQLNLVGKVSGMVESVVGEEQSILTNRHLSNDGQREALKKLGVRVQGNAGEIVRMREANKTNIGRMEQAVFAFLENPRDESDSRALIRELRASEIRSTYDDGHGASTAFLQALTRGTERDLEQARALIHGPLGSMVSPEALEGGRREYAERKDAEGLSRLDELNKLEEFFADPIISTLYKWIANFGVDQKALAEALHLTEKEGQRK